MNRTIVSALRSYSVALRHFGKMVEDNVISAADLEKYTGLTAEDIARADDIRAVADGMVAKAAKSK